MKFTANRKMLLESFRSMLRLVQKNNPVKELQGFLIEANEDDGFLYLTANNLECAMQRKIKPKIETGGGFVMDAWLLTDVLGVLDGEEVTIEEVKKGIAEICAGNCTYTLRTLDGGKYPRPEIPFPDEMLSIKGVKKLFERTASTVPSDDKNTATVGIHVDISPKMVRAASCNTTCISIVEQEHTCGGSLSFTLPKTTFSYLAGAVTNDDVLEVGVSGNSITFMKEGLLFSAKTLPHEYIKVDGLISAIKPVYAAKTEYEELKEQLINICDIAAFGKTKSYVRLDLGENEIFASTGNDLGAGSGTVSAVRVKGEKDYTFYYRHDQLKNLFKTVDGTMILQVDKRGYLMAFNRSCKYLITPMQEFAVRKQEEQIEKLRAAKKETKKAA